MSRRYVKWYELESKKFALETNKDHEIVVMREALPVVFVPGIMGSRLRQSQRRRIAWDPPDPDRTIESGRAAATWIARNPAERRALLIGEDFNPEFLEVDPSDAAGLTDRGVPAGFAAEAVNRGWGGVHWASYGPFLQRLETQAWAGDLTRYFHFPAYAIGYNWTASNETSGQKIAQRIAAIIAENNTQERFCEKVMIVSHSMGGLASRAAMKLSGAESMIAGVIHTVQPVTGAPTAYKNMKAGFDGAAQLLLGRNAGDVTAIVGNAPGGLELLPTEAYRTNPPSAGGTGSREWLRAESGHGVAVSLPKSDPYNEIYAERHAFWRLVDEALLDPDGQTPGRRQPWTEYVKRVQGAKLFHQKLRMQMHANTYTVHGVGVAQPTFDKVVWRLSEGTKEGGDVVARSKGPATVQSIQAIARGNGVSHISDGNGTIDITTPHHRPYKPQLSRWEVFPLVTARLEEPAGAGDGTVPESSGSALGGVKRAGTVANVAHDAALRLEVEPMQAFVDAALQRIAKGQFDERTQP